MTTANTVDISIARLDALLELRVRRNQLAAARTSPNVTPCFVTYLEDQVSDQLARLTRLSDAQRGDTWD